MCNCGKKREDYGTARSSVSNVPKNTSLIQNGPGNDVYFEYTGKSALSVMGKISNRQYRFHAPGNIQAIDSRDAPGMMAVPVLKIVNR